MVGLLGFGCQSASPQVVEVAASSTSTWKSYAIPGWNATLRYPPEAEPNPVSPPNLNATFGGDFVAYFQPPYILFEGSLEQATLSVVTDCSRLRLWNTVLARPSVLLPATTTLDGREFTLHTTGRSNTTHHGNTFVYVYREGERCLGLALSTYESVRAAYDPKLLSPFDFEPLEKVFLQSIHTLHFNQ